MEARKKIIGKNETLHKEIRKNAMKPMRSRSMTSVETSMYTTDVLSKRFTETFKKSLQGKPALLEGA